MSNWISKDQALEAVQSEPELPGPIPDDMFHMIRTAADEGMREHIEEILRGIVIITKHGIAERIRRI